MSAQANFEAIGTNRDIGVWPPSLWLRSLFVDEYHGRAERDGRGERYY
jgi:hypothetical protein